MDQQTSWATSSNGKGLALHPESFDVIIAFELIEHVDCFQEFYDLLKPGGLLMLTSSGPAYGLGL
jgi:2-polyprenyl-3-methyl-5-hydroxy-6-metoxy-1,4-benzoquinol methylase